MAKTLIPEIYAKIFINCDKKTLNKCRIICKQWNFIINQDNFWKQYYLWNYSNLKSLNKLIGQLPNHTYTNLCKYKLEGKELLIDNIEAENKKSYTIINLNDNNIGLIGINALKIKHEVCIKTDRMAWINKENNTINYLEFCNPQNIRNFEVERNPLRKISIVGNLIVGITDTHSYLGFTIHILSLDEKYKDLHLKIAVGPEVENGRLKFVDGFIANNLVIVVASETANRPPIFVSGRGWVNPLEDDYTVMIWDLNRLIDALNKNERDEIKLYDSICNVKVPGIFNTENIYSCAFEKMNKTTGKLEKYYYIMCNGESGKIKVITLTEDLIIEDTKIYENEIRNSRDSINWSHICPNGMFIIYSDRSLILTSLDNYDKKIKIPFNRRFTVLNVMNTPDLLYIIYRHYALAREVISLAIIDISNIENVTAEEIPIKHIKLFEYDFGNLVYNKFLDTGIIHYNSKTNSIAFFPFSKVFCN